MLKNEEGLTQTNSVMDSVTWERRSAVITNASGQEIFRQDDVEVPSCWSQTATNIAAQKYFAAAQGETSVRQMIQRVVSTLTQWGEDDGVFSGESAAAFAKDLTRLLLFQQASFNSPVWFNVGVNEHPQSSACFINAVDDTMESILDLAKIEGMLFKYGSGSGTNLSTLRSSKEQLTGGGKPSGPVSFMRGYDAFAGVIRSGGKVRRAAKMVILNDDHPDIFEFVNCKVTEERKALALIDAGYSAEDAYASVAFQNGNNTVRLSDAFMRACANNDLWQTRAVTTGAPVDTFPANDLLHAIAEAAWECGDPGVQFDDTINRWHTCPNAGRITASNPCGEHLFLGSSSCNLASINLLAFLKEDGAFDVIGFCQAIDTLITAQDLLIDHSGFPTPHIAEVTKTFRPLGLGVSNLGALLMTLGLPYDSADGRSLAATLMAILTGQAYLRSALLAQERGAFAGFAANREPMLRVIQQHCVALDALLPNYPLAQQLHAAATTIWQRAQLNGAQHGFRNAQVTVCAPTGTISFLMDCATTGIEPELALVKYKHLAGGGMMKIVNGAVDAALTRLGYGAAARAKMVSYIEQHDTIDGAPDLRTEHAPVFLCSLPSPKGQQMISTQGHVRMLAALQPFISGGISKTVNVPHQFTVDGIIGVITLAHELGLKGLTIYRDGSKRTQPLTTAAPQPAAQPSAFTRRRLPDERDAITKKFSVAGHEGYVTVGMYEDGTPGELFIVMSKEGSTISGLMDGFATAVSLALQYGVPLSVLVNKFAHTRFEPAGFTGDKQLPMAKSILDYIFRWLALKFLPVDDRPVAPAAPTLTNGDMQADAPACATCGAIMERAGSCYKCPNCGSTSGCS